MTRQKPAPTIFYATGNPGKVMEVTRFLARYGLKVVTPTSLGIKLEIDECGRTLADNARLKAAAFLSTPASQYPILADDTGVEIDALGGEPGIKVRRWQGHQMTDQAIIDHCLARMKHVPVGRRQAKFRTVLAFCPTPNSPVEYFSGQLTGTIVTKTKPLCHPGFPFEVLLYLPQYQKMLYELHYQKNTSSSWLSHRESALTAALPRFRQIFDLKSTDFHSSC